VRPPVRRLVRIALPILLAYLVVCRVVENRRIDRPLPRSQATATPPKLTATSLLDDLRTLSSDAFEGRATDTPGGRKAGDFVAARFRDLGLQSFGGRYDQPFAFDHRSIRALWRRDRPFVKHVDGRNVIGYVTGSARADEFLVLSAHYDHLGARNGEIYHGADDNASGVAGLLAMAAYLRAHRPLHSIVFAAFDAEEPPHFLENTMGSREWIRRPTVPLDRLDMMICLDVVGHALGPPGTPDDVRQTLLALGAERSAGTAAHVHRLSRAEPGVVVRRADAEIIPPLSDYEAFWRKEIPFMLLSCARGRFYHTPQDTPAWLDWAKMAATARWLECFVRETCERPE